jgi:hypothetical protein
MEMICESETIALSYLKKYFALQGDVQSSDGSIHLADDKLTIWTDYTAISCVQFQHASPSTFDNFLELWTREFSHVSVRVSKVLVTG